MIFTVLAVAGALPAHAYLDPGTGSIILQGIIGAIVGALAFFSTGLERVKSAIGKLTLTCNFLGPRTVF